jgi:hypothetical protein
MFDNRVVLDAYKMSQELITIEARPLPRKHASKMGGVRVIPGMVIDERPTT